MKSRRRWAVWTRDEEDKDWQYIISFDTIRQAQAAATVLRREFDCKAMITRHGWADGEQVH